MEKQEKILFCNVGWMERYEGLQNGDTITGGGEGDEEGNKYEICNFSSYKGYCYGYVQPPKHGKRLSIWRIGQLDKNGKSISGVTVIWVATDPENGGRRIVGWYKNATVFERRQPFKSDKPSCHSDSDYEIDGYWIKAPKEYCKLLRSDERGFDKIPSSIGGKDKGGMGRYIWYADNLKKIPEIGELVSETRKEVLKYIREYEFSSAINQRWGGTPEEKKKVEEAAINRCIAYYEGLGYKKVTDVGKLNKGWDLEATEPDKKYLNESLNIEVKGLSRSNPSIVLTPNEYEAFKERKSNYHLAVVIKARKPDEQELFICRYSKEQGDWLVERIGSKKNLTLSAEDKIFGSIKIEIEPNKQE